MTADTPEPAAADPAADDIAAPASAPERANKPHTQRFRKPFNANRLSPEQARRQGEIARMAWEAFDGRDAVMAFLNTHHDDLDGRPLDVAVASDDGYDRVLAAIGTAAANRAGATPPTK